MDNNRGRFPNPFPRNAFYSVEGIIINIEAARMGNRREDGCRMFLTIENMEGNLINFIVTPSTYVIDYVMLREGMQATFFYQSDVPVPLIYPPQYNAVVVAPQKINYQFVTVGYFNASLVNEEQTLVLNLDSRVPIVTTNNQRFLGSPANHNLVVLYDTTTRSIPAQTTPARVIVLCDV